MSRKYSYFQRVAIGFKWSWNWKGFWNRWWGEVNDFWLVLVTLGQALFFIATQLIKTVFYPVVDLLINPFIQALKMDDTAAENIEKIISR